MADSGQPPGDPTKGDRDSPKSSDSESSNALPIRTSKKRKHDSKLKSLRDLKTGRFVSPASVAKQAETKGHKQGLGSKQPTGAKSSIDSANTAPASTVAASTLSATTFGVEFEFVLAFHEDVLNQTLTKYQIPGIIIKVIEDENDHRVLLEKNEGRPNLSYNCRNVYPSWVLEIPNLLARPEVVSRLTRSAYFRLKNTSVLDPVRYARRYVIEPLLIAKDALESAGLDPTVIAWIQKRDNDVKVATRFSGFPDDNKIFLQKYAPDYREWTLANDYTLIGLPKSALLDRLQERLDWTAGEEQQWDSYGIELISPVFDFATQDAAIGEIDHHLQALTRQPRIDVFQSIWAHMHVHIGFQLPNEHIAVKSNLPFFQHVAYILILHEDRISGCFSQNSCGLRASLPKHSPPTPPAEPLSSSTSDDSAQAAELNDDPNLSKSACPTHADRLAAPIEQSDANLSATEAAYTGYGTVSSNARYFASLHCTSVYPPPTSVIRDVIFNKDGTVRELISKIQGPKDISAAPITTPDAKRNRGFMVNWDNIWKMAGPNSSNGWKNFKPTIELRQHPCCIDAAQLAHWVKLLKAVMDVATAKTLQTTDHEGQEFDEGIAYALRETSKYNTAHQPCGSIGEFCRDLLGLNEVEVEYWTGRYETFKDDRPATEAEEET